MHIVEGLDKAPEALPMLYTGGNMGKLLVHFEARDSSLLTLRYRKCHKGIRRDRESKFVNFVLEEPFHHLVYIVRVLLSKHMKQFLFDSATVNMSY